jgi:DNA-directed RNA polymerase alpha subunit
MKNITREEYLKAIDIIHQYVETAKQDIKNADSLMKKYRNDFIGVSKNTRIRDTGLSVRTINCLKASTNLRMGWDDTVGSLENQFTLKELLAMRNFGSVSIKEINRLFTITGMKFKEENA